MTTVDLNPDGPHSPERTAEARGRIVRQTFVAWAMRQPDPKPSWLVPWPQLDAGQREVDMLIGDAVAAHERERLRLAGNDHQPD